MGIASVIQALQSEWIVELKTATGYSFIKTFKASCAENAVKKAKSRYTGVYIKNVYKGK